MSAEFKVLKNYIQNLVNKKQQAEQQLKEVRESIIETFESLDGYDIAIKILDCNVSDSESTFINIDHEEPVDCELSREEIEMYLFELANDLAEEGRLQRSIERIKETLDEFVEALQVCD